MAIIRKIPWTRQPPIETNLDYGNPLTSQIYSAVNLNGKARDAARNHFMEINGNPVLENMPSATSNRLAGRGYNFDGTGDYIRSPGSASDYPALPSGSRHTITLIFKHEDTANGKTLCTGYAEGSNRFTIRNADTGRIVYQPGNVSLFSSFNKFVDGKTYVISCVNRPSGAELWWDGVLLKSNTSDDSPFIGGSFPYKEVTIGANATATGNLTDGNISLAVFHDRNLTVGEIQSFHANPWQIFNPRTQIIPVEVAAAGGLSIPVAMNSYRQRQQMSMG